MEPHIAPTAGAESAPATIESSGLRLRRAREARGLSVDEVASMLRLRAHHVEALENQDLDRLPGASYVCGYLRAYAKAMELPSDDIVQNFPGVSDHLSSVRSTRMATPILPARRQTGRGGPAYKSQKSNMIVLTLAIVLTGWLAYERGWFTRAPVSTPVETVAAPSAEKGTGVTQEPQPEASAPQSNATADTTAPATLPPVTFPPGTATSDLQLQFTGDSWAEVTDSANRHLLNQMGKAGQILVVRGEAPFKISLGAATQVGIVYNGLVFDMSAYHLRDAAAFELGRATDNRPPVTGE